MKRPRILLADDHRLVVEACASFLEREFTVVGIADDGRALLSMAQQCEPDIIIIDIGMPLLNGLDAARQLRELMPAVKLIFLTMNDDAGLAREALRIGASGYLLKSSAVAELREAIHAALQGRTYVTLSAHQRMIESFTEHGNRPNGELTVRQREVLQVLAEGYSMKEAAKILRITPRTVAFHKYQAMRQLRLKSNAELVQFAVNQHLVIGPDSR